MIKRFYKTCCIVINNDTIGLINPQVILGHETTLVAELANMPPTINSFYIKNTFFEDMPNNQCELILTINGLPQKQCVLNNNNHQEVRFGVEKGQWIVEAPSRFSFFTSNLHLWAAIFLLTSILMVIIIKKEKVKATDY